MKPNRLTSPGNLMSQRAGYSTPDPLPFFLAFCVQLKEVVQI
jgi:hypothetical protein